MAASRQSVATSWGGPGIDATGSDGPRGLAFGPDGYLYGNVATRGDHRPYGG
jgi:hypothetical protein